MPSIYGFPGDVSFVGQDRYLAYYNGPAGSPAPARFGNVRPVLSGNYTGAPGKRIMRQMTTRERDGAMFASLGIRMAGPRYDSSGVRAMALRGGGLGDMSRADCNTLMTTASALATLASAATRAGIPQPPTRRTGESNAAFETRLRSYRQRYGDRLDAALALTTGGQALSASASLCNLIDETQPPVTVPDSSSRSGELSAWERALMSRSSSQTSSGGGISTQTVVLGVGALAVAGAVAYFLLK